LPSQTTFAEARGWQPDRWPDLVKATGAVASQISANRRLICR
jgi:hypothetical protein